MRTRKAYGLFGVHFYCRNIVWVLVLVLVPFSMVEAPGSRRGFWLGRRVGSVPRGGEYDNDTSTTISEGDLSARSASTLER